MIPPLTAMPASPAPMPATATTPATIDAAMPGFAEVFALLAVIVAESAAPQAMPKAAASSLVATLAAGLPAPVAAAGPLTPTLLTLPAPQGSKSDGGECTMPARSALPEAEAGQAALLAPDAMPPATLLAGLEPSPPAVPAVALLPRQAAAIEARRLPLPQPRLSAAGVSTPALRMAVSSITVSTRLPGKSLQAQALAQSLPSPVARVAVLSVLSNNAANPGQVGASGALAGSALARDEDSETTVPESAEGLDLVISARVESLTSAVLAPSLSVAEAVASLPKMLQAVDGLAFVQAEAALTPRSKAIVAGLAPSRLTRPDVAAPAGQGVLISPGTVPPSALSPAMVMVEPIALIPASDWAPGPPAKWRVTPGTTEPAPMTSRPIPAIAPASTAVIAQVLLLPSAPSALSPSPALLVAPPAPVAASQPAVQVAMPGMAPAAVPSSPIAMASPLASTLNMVAATANGTTSAAAATMRAAPPIAAPRLRREAGDGDPASGLVASAEPVAMRAALRAEITSAATAPGIADVEISTPSAVDLAIDSPRLGAVRIGIEGGAGDLKVSLGLSPAAAALVAADAPRLIADLAAGGVRLQSLDVSGGGGGQQQPPSHHAPASPRTAAPPVPMNPIAARASTADRYA